MTGPRHDPILLPALGGREPLGFLAALGVLRLLADLDVALSWDESSGCALMHTPWRRIDDVVDALVEAVEGTADTDLVPSLSSDLVPAKVGSAGADPARIAIARLGELTSQVRTQADLDWIASVWTDLADDSEGRCARTPFNAPAGQQTMRSMFVAPRSIVAGDPRRWLREAVESWSRVPGHTGEGLDSRALRDTSELPEAKDPTYGVPGATYLALLAIPLFRMSGNGVLAEGDPKRQSRTRRSTVAWHRSARPRRNVFAWPLWKDPLDLAAATVLLDHPDVARAVELRLIGREVEDLSRLYALGVWAIAAASRRKSAAGKSEGSLTQEWVWRAG